jgi:hypothetical protein
MKQVICGTNDPTPPLCAARTALHIRARYHVVVVNTTVRPPPVGTM